MSRKCDLSACPVLSLEVCDDLTLAGFATLLQSGMYLEVAQGCSIGELLSRLPGFTEDYIAEKVQTIFLNGLPADDLAQKLKGESAVLAVSAAMPGLAGAIFRKGGIHASLRTAVEAIPVSDKTEKFVRIRLKLFNMIAKDRGVPILRQGCVVLAADLRKFLMYRGRLADNISHAEVDQGSLEPKDLSAFLDAAQYIHLFISKNI
jgi:hypothetical protein